MHDALYQKNLTKPYAEPITGNLVIFETNKIIRIKLFTGLLNNL